VRQICRFLNTVSMSFRRSCKGFFHQHVCQKVEEDGSCFQPATGRQISPKRCWRSARSWVVFMYGKRVERPPEKEMDLS